MAAPESSHDLSVVSEAPESAAPASGEPTPAAAPAKPAAPAESREKRRRGVPWWVVAIVALVGIALFLAQYQRAELLDAQVQSLAAELEEAGQQLTAYQTHLDAVRAGVTDLSDRVQSLKTLADVDPLAPPAPETPATIDSIEGISPPSSILLSEPIESGAQASLDQDSAEVLGGLLATSFEDAGPQSPLSAAESGAGTH